MGPAPQACVRATAIQRLYEESTHAAIFQFCTNTPRFVYEEFSSVEPTVSRTPNLKLSLTRFAFSGYLISNLRSLLAFDEGEVI